MHHIAGDLNSPQNLYLPSILKSFSKIWEQVVITIILIIIIILVFIFSKIWEQVIITIIILIIILITITIIHFDNSHTEKNLINGPMAGLIT